MSALAFTPGPWMRDGISVTVERPASEKRQCIAITSPHTDLPSINSCERMKANARLIAAAPELYEALGICLGIAERQLKNAMNLRGQSPFDIGMDALRKARGDQ